ncbi:MAG TPA: hypothetical protein PKK85_00360, partial [Methanobacteriaceae archaeon]|nr:hypothetical protein [Methanobacteriaceae archaeon]
MLIAENYGSENFPISDFVSLNPETVYYWKVVAEDSNGGISEGAIWSFRTVHLGNYPPSIPANPDPSDGAYNVPVTTSLSWTCNDLDNDPIVYDVYFGTSSNANDLSLIAENYGSENFPLSDLVSLDPETIYYWKVVA